MSQHYINFTLEVEEHQHVLSVELFNKLNESVNFAVMNLNNIVVFVIGRTITEL